MLSARLGRRSEGPTLESQMAESGEVFLGGGSEPPPHQLGGLEERCKLPQRALENFKFGAFWDLKIASKQCNLLYCTIEQMYAPFIHCHCLVSKKQI